MRNITIFIDESGTLPDPKDKVVIVAAVGTNLPQAKQNLAIFTLTVEKNGQKIADSPENFAFLCWLLLKDCFLFYKENVKQIIFDRHFHKTKDQQNFNQTLISLLGKKVAINHADSLRDQRLNTADMVAGSMLWLKIKNLVEPA